MTALRSWLFVPGDSERKIARAFGAGADVVIFDLEDSVAPERKGMARVLVAEALAAAPVPAAVRINPLAGPHVADDLVAVMPGRPSIVVLPKSERGADVEHLGAMLAVHEAEAGIPDGATRIHAIATETARALFGLGSYEAGRLVALSWGAEDLSAALGATRVRRDDGTLTGPFEHARTLCLAGAVAAGVAPIDAPFTDFRDLAGLEGEAVAAAADGFLGKLAIHPAQVGPINAAFTPSAEAVAHARAVLEAFAASPGAGVVSLGGRMLDRPHLVNAERLLARAVTGG